MKKIEKKLIMISLSKPDSFSVYIFYFGETLRKRNQLKVHYQSES